MDTAILVWLVCGVAAAFIAENRGSNGLLWFLLGPLGLICSFTSGSDRVCRACRKRVHPKAIRCPYCRSDLSTRPLYRCSTCRAENSRESSSRAQCGAPFPRESDGK